MARLSVLSGHQICRILQQHGFKEVRQRGSHVVMQLRTQQSTITVPVPDHPGGRLAIEAPEVRAVALTATPQAAEMRFTYRGASAESKPLGSVQRGKASRPILYSSFTEQEPPLALMVAFPESLSPKRTGKLTAPVSEAL